LFTVDKTSTTSLGRQRVDARIDSPAPAPAPAPGPGPSSGPSPGPSPGPALDPASILDNSLLSVAISLAGKKRMEGQEMADVAGECGWDSEILGHSLASRASWSRIESCPIVEILYLDGLAVILACLFACSSQDINMHRNSWSCLAKCCLIHSIEAK